MKKVLIIEDDALIGKLIEMRLLQRGEFRVLRAFDGEEGLKIVNEHEPDFIVLDLALPKKSGFDVLEELKDRKSKKPYVMVLTNLSSGQDKDRVEKLGGNDFFVKSSITIDATVDYIIKKLT